MADTHAQEGAPAHPQRKRLVLKPRSEEAAKKLEQERQAHLTKAVSSGRAGAWAGTRARGRVLAAALPHGGCNRATHHVRVSCALGGLGTCAADVRPILANRARHKPSSKLARVGIVTAACNALRRRPAVTAACKTLRRCGSGRPAALPFGPCLIDLAHKDNSTLEYL